MAPAASSNARPFGRLSGVHKVFPRRKDAPEAQQAFAAQRSGEFNLTPPEVNEAREDAPPGPPAGIAPTAPPPDVAPTVTEAEGGTGVSGSTSGPPG